MEFKAHVNLSVDGDLVDKAKQLGVNMSALLEHAIKNKMGVQAANIPIIDGEKCDFCGKIEKKATAQNLKGLTWLCPDERWICDSCLSSEMRQVVISR